MAQSHPKGRSRDTSPLNPASVLESCPRKSPRRVAKTSQSFTEKKVGLGSQFTINASRSPRANEKPEARRRRSDSSLFEEQKSKTQSSARPPRETVEMRSRLQGRTDDDLGGLPVCCGLRRPGRAPSTLLQGTAFHPPSGVALAGTFVLRDRIRARNMPDDDARFRRPTCLPLHTIFVLFISSSTPARSTQCPRVLSAEPISPSHVSHRKPAAASPAEPLAYHRPLARL